MKDYIDSILIYLYQHTPDKLKTQFLIDAAGKAAERQLSKAKQSLIKSRWEAVRLQNKLNTLKEGINNV